MIALRSSAILSILVSALYLHGLLLAFHTVQSIDWTIWLLVLGVLVPLIPGLLALFGRATALLGIAWGWQLGVHVPRALTPQPQMTPEMMKMAQQMVREHGGNFSVVGPSYYPMVLAAVAVLGAALYLIAYFRGETR
jgi:hypothetical protein